ncbi:MAG: ligand-binding sensor domain-containing protein [Saccharofermentanales bacterium]
MQKTKEGSRIFAKIKKQNAGLRLVRFAVWTAILCAVGVTAAFGWSQLSDDFTRQRPVEGYDVFLKNKDICALAFRDGEVWAGGIDGLYLLKDGSTVSETGDFRQVKAVLATDEGLWVGHDAGLSIIKDGIITTLTTVEGLPDNRVNALCLAADGSLWAGTWGGAAILDDGEVVRVLKTSEGLIDDMVNVIFQDSAGSVWFGSYVAPRGGVTILKGQKTQTFSTQNGLLHSNINAIIGINDKFVLTGGGLYTKGGGTIFSAEGDAWGAAGSIVREDGLAGDKIRALFMDSAGRLWVGSEYDGLAVFNDFTVGPYGRVVYSSVALMTQDNGLPNNEVKVVGESDDGAIWVGTRSGLLRIEKGGIQHVQ